MDVPFLFQRFVSQPAVGVHHAARLDRFLDKGDQARCRGIRHTPHTDAPDASAVFLRVDDNQCLALGLTAPNALFHSAQIHFVDFHRTLQLLPPWPHHGPAQLVQPAPGCLVAAQSQHAL